MEVGRQVELLRQVGENVAHSPGSSSRRFRRGGISTVAEHHQRARPAVPVLRRSRPLAALRDRFCRFRIPPSPLATTAFLAAEMPSERVWPKPGQRSVRASSWPQAPPLRPPVRGRHGPHRARHVLRKWRLRVKDSANRTLARVPRGDWRRAHVVKPRARRAARPCSWRPPRGTTSKASKADGDVQT